VLISVEGITEETFVREVLGPALAQRDVYLTPVVLKTRRLPGRPADKGGYIPYSRLRKELLALLGDTNATAVTTMYDLYGLPHDFPGYRSSPVTTGASRAAHLESALLQDIDSARFWPYLQVHEFEAMLFADPDAVVRVLGGRAQDSATLRAVLARFTNPEEIDDDPVTSPSHRIRELFATYQKEIAGSLIAIDIGLDRIRRACPHFDAWVGWLEGLS